MQYVRPPKCSCHPLNPLALCHSPRSESRECLTAKSAPAVSYAGLGCPGRARRETYGSESGPNSRRPDKAPSDAHAVPDLAFKRPCLAFACDLRARRNARSAKSAICMCPQPGDLLLSFAVGSVGEQEHVLRG